MHFDYSPADPTALPAARRSFLLAALVLVSVGALMSRQSAGTAGGLSAATLPAMPSMAATPIPVRRP